MGKSRPYSIVTSFLILILHVTITVSQTRWSPLSTRISNRGVSTFGSTSFAQSNSAFGGLPSTLSRPRPTSALSGSSLLSHSSLLSRSSRLGGLQGTSGGSQTGLDSNSLLRRTPSDQQGFQSRPWLARPSHLTRNVETSRTFVQDPVQLQQQQQQTFQQQQQYLMIQHQQQKTFQQHQQDLMTQQQQQQQQQQQSLQQQSSHPVYTVLQDGRVVWQKPEATVPQPAQQVQQPVLQTSPQQQTFQTVLLLDAEGRVIGQQLIATAPGTQASTGVQGVPGSPIVPWTVGTNTPTQLGTQPALTSPGMQIAVPQPQQQQLMVSTMQTQQLLQQQQLQTGVMGGTVSQTLQLPGQVQLVGGTQGQTQSMAAVHPVVQPTQLQHAMPPASPMQQPRVVISHPGTSQQSLASLQLQAGAAGQPMQTQPGLPGQQVPMQSGVPGQAMVAQPVMPGQVMMQSGMPGQVMMQSGMLGQTVVAQPGMSGQPMPVQPWVMTGMQQGMVPGMPGQFPGTGGFPGMSPMGMGMAPIPGFRHMDPYMQNAMMYNYLQDLDTPDYPDPPNPVTGQQMMSSGSPATGTAQVPGQPGVVNPGAVAAPGMQTASLGVNAQGTTGAGNPGVPAAGAAPMVDTNVAGARAGTGAAVVNPRAAIPVVNAGAQSQGAAVAWAVSAAGPQGGTGAATGVVGGSAVSPTV